MKTTYYKLLRNINNRYYSIDCPSEVRIEYIPNQFVSPVYGKLFCFDDLGKAKDFSYYYESSYFCEREGFIPEIWECNIGHKYTNPLLPRTSWNFTNVIEAFKTISKLLKQHKNIDSLIYAVHSFPKGSAFTNKINILQKVYQYDKSSKT
jgi:hypothetical protein